MKNSPPASPEELQVAVDIYKPEIIGKNDNGGDIVKYVKRFSEVTLVKESRQKSTAEIIAHGEEGLFFSRFIGNWWELQSVHHTDIIVVCNTGAQFGLNGPVVNWEQRNRWGVIDGISDKVCREGVDSANCRQ